MGKQPMTVKQFRKAQAMISNDKPLPKPTIKLTNGGLMTPEQLAKDLEEMANWLQEHNSVFECDCEDYEEPRGYIEYDTNAYIHGDDCPTNYEDHFDILCRSVAQYFKELSQ